MNINYAIVFVSDMQQATAFYKDVLGLTLRFESPDWTEFETGGATLALHLTDRPADEREPGLEPAGASRVGFNVDDLDAFHKRMEEQDVPCVQQPTSVFGSMVAQYSGPDGLVFGVGESRSG